MTAISCLLFEYPLFGLPVLLVGEMLLYLSAALTLWSMWVYLHAAWPIMSRGDSLEHVEEDSVE
jgi:phosphatidylglycerophosphate synthase